MLEQFTAYINNRSNLAGKADRIVLALSGGVDSMVLADLLLKTEVMFVAAHCNFRLRGTESDADERFVVDYAERNGIQCFVKHFDTEKYAAENGISIEMAARDLRYAWFEELRQQLGYDKIALAHHADDQAETFFINLLRGAGLRGLKGMLPQHGVLIRPLLWASREQIHQYAIENQILWREDHTNAENVFLRNKIRNLLLPIFDELHSAARQSLFSSLRHLSSENQLYRDLLNEKFEQIVVQDGCFQIVDKQWFVGNFQFLFEWLRQFGFNAEQCQFIHEAIELGVGNHYYSPTHKLVIGRQDLQVSELSGDKDEVVQIVIGDEAVVSPIRLRFSRFEKSADFVLDKSPDVAQLDFDKIRFPLTLRHWRHGDRFHPLGMKGSKLLSDFFVDQKFSDRQKRQLLLLVSAEGNIVWLVGQRIDDRFKVTSATKSVFCCSWER